MEEIYTNNLLKTKKEYIKNLILTAINSKESINNSFIKFIYLNLKNFNEVESPNILLLKDLVESLNDKDLILFILNEFLIRIDDFVVEIDLKYENELNLSYNRKQVFCLLLSMLFCLNPNEKKTLDFRNFYRKSKSNYSNEIYLEKLKGVINYFIYVKNNYNYYFSLEDLKMKRIYNKEFDIHDYKYLFLEEIEETDELIQYGDGDLINFANKSISGGTLSLGCVQEELLIQNYIESIISIFLINDMKKQEIIYLENCLFINDYSGYGSEIKFNTNKNVKINNIIFMDAMVYFNNTKSLNLISKDFLKCFNGFSLSKKDNIYSGRWGCGVFGGDFKIKIIIQWICSSIFKKKLFLTLLSKKDKKIFDEIYNDLKFKNLEYVYNYLLDYLKIN